MAWRRRALRSVAILAVLVIGLLLMAAVVSQTPWFRDRLRRLAMRQAEQVIEGQLVIGSVEGSLWSGLTLRDISVVQDGSPVVTVARAEATYGVREVMSDGRVIKSLHLEQPVVHAVRTPAGWNMTRLLKPRPPSDPNKPRATFTLPDISITSGLVTIDEVGVPATAGLPRRIEGITFDGAVASSPRELSVDVRRLTFRTAQPDLDLQSLAGRLVSIPTGWRFDSLDIQTGESALTLDGTLTRKRPDAAWAYDLDLTGRPLSLPEIGRFVPAAALPLHPHLSVGLTGTIEHLAVDLEVERSEAGQARGRLAIDATAPDRALEGRLTTTDLNLAPILRSKEAQGQITGEATFALRFPSASAGFPVDGTFAFSGPRASAYGYEASDVRAKGRLDGRRIVLDAAADAYGGRATAEGTIARPGQGQPELSLDLSGRVADVDLRRLPASLRVPALDTSLTGTYHATGPLSAVKAEATLGASAVEGAKIGEGTTVRFARTPAGFTFGAAGTVAGLDLQRLGTALDVKALTAPRFAGVVNGAFDVDGAQRGRAGLLVHATGTLTDTAVLGGRLPEVAFDATLEGQRLELMARGQVAGFDLATLSGVPALTGNITGTIDTRVSVPNLQQVSADTVAVQGTFSLEQPTLLKVPFGTVTAQVALANGVADIGQLEARGDGFTLTGHGRLGIGPGDVSDFSYRLQADSLVQPAKVADLPITGAATTEGRVTGTREEFLVTGALAGDQIAYGDTATVGVVNAQYAVRLPDFDADRLDVQATLDGQTVQVAGQTLTALSGTVGYVPEMLRFDVTGMDGLRTLAARGTLALLEQRQHLTLDRLAVQRNGVQWALAPGTTARVEITSEQATIGQLQLANGAQRAEVEGTVGLQPEAESSLRVQASGVQVSDALVLAAQEFDGDGTLNLSATIGGTRERPVADVQLELTDARVRNIPVERVSGRVTFDGTLATVDMRLQKDANSVLTANGIVPKTLFGPKPEPAGDEHVPPTPGDRLDVAITSTPLDLALAEGLTPYVQKLGGQAQVDLRLTNSGRDPHVEGALFVTNGTLLVPATGVTYQQLDAILTFDEERVVISEMGVQTTSGDLLTVEGELGLRREQARTVKLRMKGEDFRVLDNEFGVMDLDTELVISGTLVAPAVEGTIAVSEGRLELDEILPRVSTNTYATTAEYQGIPTDALAGPVVPNIMGEEENQAKPPVSDDATARAQAAVQSNQQGVAVVPAPDQPAAITTQAQAPSPAGPEAPARPATPGAPIGRAADAGEAPSADVFANTALNIQVRIPDNLVLRGQDIEAARASIGDVNATLGGDFRVTKTAGNPVVLLGVVNTVRGTYSYQGRQFDIARDGQVIFRGGTEIDPRLDITAERVIQGVEARVRITGTAQRPELSLSSNPPLDQGDILALIIFNQPLNQLGTGQQNSLAQRAGGIAAGFVVSPLAEALGSSLDLDQFEVQTTDPSGRVNPAVVIGQQVSQDMFVRFRQQFGNQQVSQFLLEYRIADFLRLQGNVAEGDGLSAGNRSLTQRIERYGADLVFFFSF